MRETTRAVLLCGAFVAAFTLATALTAAAGIHRVEDASGELSLRLPSAWRVSETSDGGMRVYTGRRFVTDPGCRGVDRTAQITIDEQMIPGRETIPRPSRFRARDGTTYEFGSMDPQRQLAEIQCDEIWQLIQFSDGGRTFVALIRSGTDGPDALRKQARRVLDSFAVRS